MKLKRTVILATLVVTMGLLLGASTAQAAPEVIFEGNNATAIQNLEVEGILYNVEFLYDSAENIYGDPPIFQYPSNFIQARAANSAVIAALNSEPAVTTVGPVQARNYLIGYEPNGDRFVFVVRGRYIARLGAWTRLTGVDRRLTRQRTYAEFTQVEVQADVIPIPRTGQTESYGAGDDGDLQKGAQWPVPRFTNNGDGTVTDHLTGLIWLRENDCFGSDWQAVLEWSNDLANGDCGLTDGSEPGDWRLPNRRELESLIDLSRSHPALPEGSPFIILATDFWTSTTYPGYEGQAAWSVEIELGASSVRDKLSNKFAWAVRDGN